MGTQKKSRFSQVALVRLLPLAAILLCALLLRLMFFTGMVRGDDLNYAHAAYELSQGRTHFDYWTNGTMRIGLYGPVALLYALFGPSEWTTLAFPFASSLLTVLIVYAIGLLLGGRKTGLVSALLWACLPLDIFLASDLLADGPTATFTAAAFLFLLLADKKVGPQRRKRFIFSLFFLLWAVLIKPIALIAVFFYVGVIGVKSWPAIRRYVEGRGWLGWAKKYNKLLISLSAAIIFALILAYALIQERPMIVSFNRAAIDLSRVLVTGETHIDLSVLRITQINLFSVLGPLFLVSAITLMLRKEKAAKFALLWAGFYFLYYEWGPIHRDPFVFRPVLFTEERSMLFILVPLVLLAGMYLSHEVKEAVVDRLVLIASGLTVLVGYVSRAAIFEGQIPQILVWLQGFVVLMFLLNPHIGILKTPSWTNDRWFAITTVMMCLSLLVPANPFHASYWDDRREEITYLRQAAEHLKDEQAPSVFVESVSWGIALNYASNFELGFDWAEEGKTGHRILVGSPQDLMPGAFYLGREVQDEASAGLERVQTFGSGRTALVLYRAQDGN